MMHLTLKILESPGSLDVKWCVCGGGDSRDIHLETGVGKEVWDVEQLREDVKGENKIWTVKKKERKNNGLFNFSRKN